MAYSTDKKGCKIDSSNSKLWYHGSPYKLTVLRKGSSITRNKELAKAFSHKPTQLSVASNGSIQHNGKLNGYLYVIDEQLNDSDIIVHEACAQDDKWEWVTKRDLKLKLIDITKLGDIKMHRSKLKHKISNNQTKGRMLKMFAVKALGGSQLDVVHVVRRKLITSVQRREQTISISSRDGHIHSPYCPHGTKDTFEQYIKKALEIGLKEITFTEHLPLPADFMYEEMRNFCSPSIDAIELYLNELDTIKEKYKNQIKINTGFEVDYLEGYEGFTKQLLNKYGTRTQDGILSIHFLRIKGEYYCMDATPQMFRELADILGGVEKLYDKYYETMLKSIKADLGVHKPKRIGHPTLVRVFNTEFPLEYNNIELLTDIMRELKSRDYEIDFNTAGLRKPYCKEVYPSGLFADLVKQYKVRVVYGSDAHTAEDVGNGF